MLAAFAGLLALNNLNLRTVRDGREEGRHNLA